MSKEARLRYREAARSFLNADFTSALRAIDAALAALPSPLSLPSWIDQLSEEATGTSTAASDQRRKVVILFVTLVATCRATLDRDLPVSARQTPLLGPYIPLKPDAVVAKLFDGAVGRFAPSPPPPSEPSPLPSPEAAYLPPSVIVALALGALKLQAPRAAKAVCEAWLGSLDERAESTLEVEGDALDAAGTPTASLTASALSLSVTSTPNTESTGSPKRDALQSYERILELYALHILPAMGAWDEAEEWVKLLARENGGYARPGKVEWLGIALREAKQHSALALEQQRLRAVAQAEHDKQLKRSAAKAPPASAAQPSKRTKRGASSKRTPRPGGAASSDEQSSAHSSPPKHRDDARLPSPTLTHGSTEIARASSDKAMQVTGFAAMRAALAAYLSPSSTTTTASSRTQLSTTDRWLRVLNDQSRLLAMVAFVFTFIAWRRRARRRLVDQAGDWASRVVETVKMATRATYL